MRVGDTKGSSTIGRQTQFSLKRFNVDQIYFSDERIDPDVLYTDTVKIKRRHKFRGILYERIVLYFDNPLFLGNFDKVFNLVETVVYQ